MTGPPYLGRIVLHHKNRTIGSPQEDGILQRPQDTADMYRIFALDEARGVRLEDIDQEDSPVFGSAD